MTALYHRVCDQIMNQIETGKLQVGDRLPPEAEFAQQIGVSRSTLRMAFAELEAAGVLQRRKRIGTRVISNARKQRFSMATTGVNELLSLGRDTTFTVSGTRTVHTREIAQLKGQTSETDHWLEVEGTRTLTGEATPFSINHVYVPARYAGIEPLLRDTRASVFRVIEDRFNVRIGRVSQTVRAIACDEKSAKVIGVASGAPVLQIEAHLFERDGRLMEISLATFDPDRFQIQTDVEIE